MLFRRKARPTLSERVRIALWPRRSFGRSFAYYKHRVLRLEASPHAIAAGVAAGAFASCTPLVGFHFLLSFVVAWMIGGSMIAAAFGTAVGNPLTFPFIWLSSFQLGQAILGRDEGAVSPLELELSFDLLWNSFATLWPTLKPMLLGGAIIGLVIGAILYVLTRSAVLVSRSLREARLRAGGAARVLSEAADETDPLAARDGAPRP